MIAMPAAASSPATIAMRRGPCRATSADRGRRGRQIGDVRATGEQPDGRRVEAEAAAHLGDEEAVAVASEAERRGDERDARELRCGPFSRRCPGRVIEWAAGARAACLPVAQAADRERARAIVGKALDDASSRRSSSSRSAGVRCASTGATAAARCSRMRAAALEPLRVSESACVRASLPGRRSTRPASTSRSTSLPAPVWESPTTRSRSPTDPPGYAFRWTRAAGPLPSCALAASVAARTRSRHGQRLRGQQLLEAIGSRSP